ncbi:hypothetical protein B0I72DRAFT_169882 [Yarrowia lipolytica]|nr:hypothetical protein B0I72DRAFT_169882 [Yarrowia lipolytica]
MEGVGVWREGPGLCYTKTTFGSSVRRIYKGDVSHIRCGGGTVVVHSPTCSPVLVSSLPRTRYTHTQTRRAHRYRHSHRHSHRRSHRHRQTRRAHTHNPPRKTHARSDISAAAIGRTVGGTSPVKEQAASSSAGVRSADSSPRVSQASFAVPQTASTGLGLSIPTSPTPRRRPSKRGHRRSTSDILHNSTGGVSGVFKVDKPQERAWGTPAQPKQSPQKYHAQIQHSYPPNSYPPNTYPQNTYYPPPPPPQQHSGIHYPPQHYPPPPPPPPPPQDHGSPTVTPSGMVHHSPPHALGQAFQPQPPQPSPQHQRQYNYTHAPPYGSPPQYSHQSHSPTRPSPLHGPPQTPPTSNPTSASGTRPTLAPLHVSLPPISTSINSPTSAPDRVTLPPMRAIYEPVMPYGDVTSPRAHLPSPAPHSPGQREVDDDAAESLMYFSSPRR